MEGPFYTVETTHASYDAHQGTAAEESVRLRRAATAASDAGFIAKSKECLRAARVLDAERYFGAVEIDTAELALMEVYYNSYVSTGSHATFDAPDDVLIHLGTVNELDCFNRYVVLEREGTQQGVLMGILETGDSAVPFRYFRVAAWHPTEVALPTYDELVAYNRRMGAEEAADRRKAEAERENKERIVAAERRRVKRFAWGAWLLGLLPLVVLAILFLFILSGWWQLLPMSVVVIAAALTYDEMDSPNKGSVMAHLVVPLVAANVVVAGAFAFCYAEFAPYTKTITLCGSGRLAYDAELDTDVPSYYDLSGTEYRLSDQVPSGVTYSRIKVQIKGRGLLGTPTIVSAHRISDASEACLRANMVA